MLFRFFKVFKIKRKMSTFSEDIAVKKLIQYLRIKTVHPEPDYGKRILFSFKKSLIKMNNHEYFLRKTLL